MKQIYNLLLTAILIIASTLNVSAQFGGSDAEITAYSFSEQTGDATITAPNYGQNGTVDIEVESGTDLSNLVASFTLSDGATADISGTAQTSGTTANDFSNTVTYTVTAEDGSTTQDWDVNVSIAPDVNDEADILAYSFAEQTGDATITAPAYGQNGTVDIEVEYGTDLSSLIASFTLSEAATADISGTAQTSGTTANDFSNTVTYTVTAEDGSTTQDWDVSVSVAPEVNDEADILAYSFAEQTGDATITAPVYGQNGTIEIEVVYGTDITNLIATFTLSNGASAEIGTVDQLSGTTENDFSNTVTYTVTAEDGSTTQDWDVNVSIAQNTENNIIAYSFSEQTNDANIDLNNHHVTIEVANGTDVSNLIATFTLSDNASAEIESVNQVSGTTENDFSNVVTYSISAENGDIQDWTVEVQVATNITALQNNSVNIYPNPSRGLINISNSIGSEIIIFNTLGQIVFNDILDNQSINLSKLKKGVYFVKITNNLHSQIKTISITE